LPKSPIEDRDIRQRDIAAPEKLADTTAYVIGVGAIGRQVALQLAAIGVGKLVLVDFDSVGPENLAVQGFFEADLGRAKVEAVAHLCKSINSGIDIQIENDKFKKAMLIKHGPGVVFSCVDTMKSREFIWKHAQNSQMYVDGRMAAEICRVLTVRSKKDHKYYESTLFSDSEAFPATCTAKSTLYCANVAAGMMVAQLTKMYRGIPYDKDVQLNILANEMHYLAEKSADKAAAAD